MEKEKTKIDTKAPKKEKKKKEKRVLGVPVNFDFGEKVKDFKIDVKKHKVTSLVYLIVLNIMLIAVMVYFLSIINNGLTITIAIFTMLACLVWSVMNYVFSVLKIKYSLFENAIVKSFDTSVNVGELNKLTSIKIGKGLLDKMGKNKTSTITLRFANKWCSKIVLSCIDEDINKVAEDIILYSGKAKQKNPVEKKKSSRKKKKSIIRLMIDENNKK